MIKECKVVLHNQYVTVVEYDGAKIQFPSVGKKVDTVYVKCENNKYSIVPKGEYEKSKQSNKTVSKGKLTKSDNNTDNDDEVAK